MFVLWSNYSAAFFVAYCTHPFFRNLSLLSQIPTFKTQIFPRYSQRHPIVYSFSDCVAIFFLIFSPSNSGNDSEFQSTFGSKRIKQSRYDLSLFDVSFLRKSFKQINRELIKHFTSLVINQNLLPLAFL